MLSAISPIEMIKVASAFKKLKKGDESGIASLLSVMGLDGAAQIQMISDLKKRAAGEILPGDPLEIQDPASAQASIQAIMELFPGLRDAKNPDEVAALMQRIDPSIQPKEILEQLDSIRSVLDFMKD